MCTPENATNKTVTWASDANYIASVDSNGLVTGVYAGKCNITATCGEMSISCQVTVTYKAGSRELPFSAYNENYYSTANSYWVLMHFKLSYKSVD